MVKTGVDISRVIKTNAILVHFGQIVRIVVWTIVRTVMSQAANVAIVEREKENLVAYALLASRDQVLFFNLHLLAFDQHVRAEQQIGRVEHDHQHVCIAGEPDRTQDPLQEP